MKLSELLDLMYANFTIYERRNNRWYCVDEVQAKNKDIIMLGALDMGEIVVYVEGDKNDNERSLQTNTR